MKELANVTSRRAARLAARLIAGEDLTETTADAAREAAFRGEDEATAEREHLAAVAAQPGSASEAWLNAGCSQLLGLAPRWEAVFLAEYDRATTAYARRALAADEAR